jgi:hypothetical protein
MVSNSQNVLEILNKDLNPNEKDECKIIISDYLNNPSKNKKLEAKNANQLFFIVDYLIQYINNKERVFKEKIGNLNHDNKEIIKILEVNKNKFELLEESFKNNLDIKEKLKNLKINFEYDSGLRISKAKYISGNLLTEENIRKKEEINLNDNKFSERASDAASNSYIEEKKKDQNNRIENNLSNQIIYKKSFPKNKKI